MSSLAMIVFLHRAFAGGGNLRNNMGNIRITNLLERAIELSVSAHEGQTDKAGKPYILHPLRVLMRLEDPESRIVAVLHDVLEDGSPQAAEEARKLLPPELYEALLGVMKREDEHGPEGYARFIGRASKNPISRSVKIADLEDNLDVTRLNSVGPADAERLERYLEALRRLKAMEYTSV